MLRDSPFYTLILILVLVGAFSKSAQWPLHFWLPGAMEAPTPASAYLHSATMVKAGIFLLARLSPILNGTSLWFYATFIIGSITFLYAAVIAFRQTDLKAILAYSTVSWLGILVALQATGSVDATKALIVGILAHALYKGALFLGVGSIQHGTGTRNITLLGGLGRKMPFTTAGAVIAALSMAGIPPLLGFLAKETLKVAALDEILSPTLRNVFPAVAVIGSALTVAVALRILWDTFFAKQSPDIPHHPHEASPAMWFGPLALGSLTIILPLLLAQMVEPLLNAAVSAVTGMHQEIHLHLFEGVTTPFLLSMTAIALGVGLFAIRRKIASWLQARPELNPIAIYRWLFLRALPDGAHRLTDSLQNGSLRFYIMLIMSSFVALALSTIILSRASVLNSQAFSDFDWQFGIICLLLVVGAIAGAAATTRLSAIIIFGIEGALISLVFALYGAPDLAFTQLMIEVVSLVLFILAFHFLPDTFSLRQPGFRRIRDIVVAAAVGITVALLVLVTDTQAVAPSISSWYLDNSYLLGHGHNVVNVILVDFRGLDTQGEIVVLVIAAMGVAALLRLKPSDQPRGRHFRSSNANLDSPEESVGE